MRLSAGSRSLGQPAILNDRTGQKAPNTRASAGDHQPHASHRHRRSVLAAPVLLCGCGRCRSAAAAGPPSPAPRNAVLDRLFAENMFTGMAEYEAAIAPVKRRLFSQLAPPDGAAGRPLEVVEVGAGTGPNLPFYPEKARARITAVDPNAYMRPYFFENAAAAGLPEGAVTWQEGVAEALPLPDACADAVVCTLVLCSVGDVAAAVAEARRVLRPGGRLLFIEHTTAAVDRAPLLWAAQRVFNPLQRAFADGCNLTRDPLPAIQGAGFSAVEAARFEVEGASLIAPHVAGIAVVQIA